MFWAAMIAGCTPSTSLEAPELAARFVDPPDPFTLGALDERLGDGVAVVGDLDGDGYEDLVAASSEADERLTDFGRLDLFMGGASGPGGSVAFSGVDGNYPMEPGAHISVLGDMDGLGQLWVVVGSPFTSTGFTWYYTVAPGSLLRGGNATSAGYGGHNWGWATVGADADGDGLVDLVGGDPDNDFSFAREGRVAAHDWLGNELWEVRGGADYVDLGESLAALDLDGDGFDELVAGAPGNDALWVFAGSATGLSTVPAVVPGLPRLGEAMVTADVDGDGVDDLVVGAPFDDGAVQVWLGGAGALSTPVQSIFGTEPFGALGTALAAPGDIDGDGYDDILAASSSAWFLYVGGPGGLQPEPAWTLHADDLLLGSVDVASVSGGDLDGDGYDDIVLGIPDWADPDLDQGALLWVRGGPRDVDDDGFDATLDCVDWDPDRFPGAPELCDGLDNDCDGTVPTDEDDADADGYRICGGDCDDLDVTRFPGATETCNGLDDDCDGSLVDELDLDSDGYFICGGDCNDSLSWVNPGAQEVCGTGDEDCDGLDDDDDPDVIGLSEWHADDDNDGFGSAPVVGQSCRQPNDVSLNGDDCDDTNGDVFPGSDELCNGIDDDCDLLIDASDDSLTDGRVAYPDTDGDGFGDAARAELACELGELVADATDCDDTSASVHPDADEVCNAGIDDDCDLLADLADPSLVDGVTAYTDADGDGFGDPATGELVCEPGELVIDATDCDDADPSAWLDQDCDGTDVPADPPEAKDRQDEEGGGCGCGHTEPLHAAWLGLLLAGLARRR